uniref:Uncharacterized protein n=1 Tax=Amblyomma triste TaxID=251400 RepID=A0A023G1G3_AMBTT
MSCLVRYLFILLYLPLALFYAHSFALKTLIELSILLASNSCLKSLCYLSQSSSLLFASSLSFFFSLHYLRGTCEMRLSCYGVCKRNEIRLVQFIVRKGHA